MALSLSSRPLFTSSYKSFSPLRKPYFSFPIRQYRILFVHDPSNNNKSTRNRKLRRRNSFPTHVSAVLQEAPAPTEKIVLPTNESSEGLLRIRHTVMLILDGWVGFWVLQKLNCFPVLLYLNLKILRGSVTELSSN